MTLATWGGIKTELLVDTNRAGDAVFLARIPRFIESALQRIHFGGGGPLMTTALRISAMRTTASVVISDGTGQLPGLFLEADTVSEAADKSVRLTYKVPTQFHQERSRNVSGAACSYTIEGETLSIDAPLESTTIELAYYAKFATPTADSDTNWLMTNAPSILFDGLRIEAYQHLRNTEMMQTAFASFASAVDGLQTRDTIRKASGGPLYPRRLIGAA